MSRPAPRRPDAPASQTALDPAPLEILAKTLPASKVAGLVRLYLDYAEGALARIEASAPRAELSALTRDAHNLAGAAGNIGAGRVTALARALESACASGDPERSSGLVRELAEAASEAAAALREWLDARASAAAD